MTGRAPLAVARATHTHKSQVRETVGIPAHTGHFGSFGSTSSPKLSKYLVFACTSVDLKQSWYFSPPSLPQDQCQVSWSVGFGRPAMPPKKAFVAWHRHVLYIAQDPVALYLQAAQASALLLKPPSLPVAGMLPIGCGGGCDMLDPASAPLCRRCNEAPQATCTCAIISTTRGAQGRQMGAILDDRNVPTAMPGDVFVDPGATVAPGRLGR